MLKAFLVIFLRLRCVTLDLITGLLKLVTELLQGSADAELKCLALSKLTVLFEKPATRKEVQDMLAQGQEKHQMALLDLAKQLLQLSENYALSFISSIEKPETPSSNG